MPKLADRITADADSWRDLITITAHRTPIGGFDSRPTWDNQGGTFDNRPTWDNWSK
jgi:hypothetical protein